ncbi:MAG: class E sortase [Egibacteraceae bacterium]
MAVGASPAVAAAPAPHAPVTFERGATVAIGRLIAPGIGLDVPFSEGVYDEVLERGPGHWPGTPLPGELGNAVLSGHRTTFTKPFANLDLLAPGDEITTGIGHLPGVEFKVVETRIVPEAEYAATVLAQPLDPHVRRLTLFACHPKGQRTHRIVVIAEAGRGG